MDPLAVLFAVLVIGGVAWACVAPPASVLTISVREGKVTLRGAVAQSQRADLVRFFEASFPAERTFTVRVLPDIPGRPMRPRYDIRGNLTIGEVQQVRNYLHHFVAPKG